MCGAAIVGGAEVRVERAGHRCKACATRERAGHRCKGGEFHHKAHAPHIAVPIESGEDSQARVESVEAPNRKKTDSDGST